MAYHAVALSQVDGAGGESIGRDVAERLGYGYLNEAVIAQVASDHGVDPAMVAEAERRKSFFDRLALVAAQGGFESVAVGPSYADETETLLSLIRDAVRDAAERGKVVLVAHAACYACADLPDVLRVNVTAPIEARVARLSAAQGISDKDAAKALHRGDTGRASYLKRTYGINRESPTDYDVIVNTDRVTPQTAVDLIAGLVQASEG